MDQGYESTYRHEVLFYMLDGDKERVLSPAVKEAKPRCLATWMHLNYIPTSNT